MLRMTMVTTIVGTSAGLHMHDKAAVNQLEHIQTATLCMEA